MGRARQMIDTDSSCLYHWRHVTRAELRYVPAVALRLPALPLLLPSNGLCQPSPSPSQQSASCSLQSTHPSPASPPSLPQSPPSLDRSAKTLSVAIPYMLQSQKIYKTSMCTDDHTQRVVVVVVCEYVCVVVDTTSTAWVVHDDHTHQRLLTCW